APREIRLRCSRGRGLPLRTCTALAFPTAPANDPVPHLPRQLIGHSLGHNVPPSPQEAADYRAIQSNTRGSGLVGTLAGGRGIDPELIEMVWQPHCRKWDTQASRRLRCSRTLSH